MHWLSINYQWVVAVVAMPIILLLLKRWVDSPKKVNVNIGQPTPAMRPPEPVRPAPSPKSNIKFVEGQSVEAHQGIDDGRLHNSPSGLGDFRLAVVCFRNDAIVGQAVTEPELKAHIIYRDRNGKEVTDSQAGVWLGQYGEVTAFTLGHKKCLVIFLLSRQSTLMKVWNETYTTRDNWMTGRPLFRIGQEGLSHDVASVSVSLLAEDTCLLQAEFDVEERRNNDLPKVVLRSISEG